MQKGASFIIVRRGRPIATLTPPTREAIEAFVFANSEAVADRIQSAEKEMEHGNVRVLGPDDVLGDEYEIGRRWGENVARSGATEPSEKRVNG